MENINNIEYFLKKIGFKEINPTLLTAMSAILQNNLVALLGEDFTFDIEKNIKTDDDNIKVVGYNLKINSNFDNDNNNQIEFKIIPNKLITIINKKLNKDLSIKIISDKEIVIFKNNNIFKQTIKIKKNEETLPVININELENNTKTNTIFETFCVTFKTGQEYIMQHYKNTANNFSKSKSYIRDVYENNPQDIANYCNEIFNSFDNFKKKESEKIKSKRKRK